jgi:hypothetical protein
MSLELWTPLKIWEQNKTLKNYLQQWMNVLTGSVKPFHFLSIIIMPDGPFKSYFTLNFNKSLKGTYTQNSRVESPYLNN